MPEHFLDRRTLLKSMAGALPLASPGLRAAISSASGDESAPGIPWQQNVRRVGQLNMTEHDPVVLNVEEWADYWASLKVEVTYVSVTGILAFYPTKVPFHRIGRYLGGRDFFGEVNAAARQRGIRTVARMSPDLNWREALDAHPEWFQRNQDGSPRPTPDDPRLFATCMFSTYMTDYVPAIMREINSRYEVDAFYTNGWPPIGRLPVCFCNVCRKLPPAGSGAYWEAFNQRVIYLWKLYDGIAKEKSRTAFYFANLGGGTHAAPNLALLATVCEWFQGDNQGRGGDGAPIWGASLQGRVCRSVLGNKTAVNVVGAWSTGRILWRESVKSIPEMQMWFNETVASGMTPYLHVIGGEDGLGEDRRFEKFGRDYFNWQASNDSHLRPLRTIAEIGVVYGQRTQLFYTPPRDASRLDSMQGIYAALLEGRFFFDFVHEDHLALDRIGRYRALILPNIALLSDAQCAQLRAYAAQGGSLLATFETSLYDETGRRRGDFGLADLFGAHATGPVIAPVGNSNPFYAWIERPHPVLDGFQDTNWLPGPQYRVPVSPTPDPVLTVVPGFPAYPPELSYPRVPRTREPALILRETGGSRIAYIPSDIERSLWISGNADLSRLLQNTIRWVAGDGQPAAIEGEGFIEAFAWETKPGFAVHVLNYNNPNTYRGYLRKFYPIGEQRVRLRLPPGRTIAKVELLRAGGAVPHSLREGTVEFTIPSVLDYEVAALS